MIRRAKAVTIKRQAPKPKPRTPIMRPMRIGAAPICYACHGQLPPNQRYKKIDVRKISQGGPEIQNPLAEINDFFGKPSWDPVWSDLEGIAGGFILRASVAEAVASEGACGIQCTTTAGIGAGMVIHSYQSSQTDINRRHDTAEIGNIRYYGESAVNKFGRKED